MSKQVQQLLTYIILINGWLSLAFPELGIFKVVLDIGLNFVATYFFYLDCKKKRLSTQTGTQKKKDQIYYSTSGAEATSVKKLTDYSWYDQYQEFSFATRPLKNHIKLQYKLLKKIVNKK